MSQVCRTCLEVVGNASQLFSLEINETPIGTVHLKTKLEACVPEIALHRVKNSVICIYCLGALNTAYAFKTKCLQTETKLSEYMTRETTDSIDLNKFVRENPINTSIYYNQINRAPIVPLQPLLPFHQISRPPMAPMPPVAPMPHMAPVAPMPHMTTVAPMPHMTPVAPMPHMTPVAPMPPVAPMAQSQPLLLPPNNEIIETDPLVTTCDISSTSILPEDNIKCPVCQQCFTSNDFLKEHMKYHTEENFKCSMCDFNSNSILYVEEHIKSHNGLATIQQYSVTSPTVPINPEALFKCPNCEYVTTDRYLFIEHRVLHTGERLYQCTMCNFKSTHSSSLRRHVKIHTGDRPFRCTVCRYGSADITGLRIHMRVHTGERPFKCTECTYTAIKRSNLRNHMTRVHGEPLPNPLSVGNGLNGDLNPTKMPSDSASQANDTVPYSPKVDPYQVTINDIQNILQEDEDSPINEVENTVDDTEPETTDVESYMVTAADIQEVLQSKISEKGLEHNKQKIQGDFHESEAHNNVESSESLTTSDRFTIFRCPVCEEPFKFKYLLKKHLSVHRRDNVLYECTECGYSTQTKSHFQVHVNTHTGGKIYTCDQCEYSTIYWSNMQKHNRVHSGDRPYKCPYCNYRASQQASIKCHMHIHTDNRPYLCNECPYTADTELALQSHMEMHAIGHNFMEEDILFVPSVEQEAV